MDQRIAGIWEKLEQAQKIWHKLPDNIGVRKHKFQVNPPLSKAEIEAFEAKHNIILPEDYAAFLQYIGNGGAGPYYGILPLEHWNYGLQENPSLATPSILTKELCQESKWAEYLKQYETDEEWEVPYDGAITTCDEGCANSAILIVTGEERGRVCNIGLDNHAPLFVKDPDFLSWYERWLDETLAGKEFFWYGFD